MEPRTLARPYARAVFELASTEGTRQAWGEFLTRLTEVLGAPELAHELKSPMLSRDQLAQVIGDALLGEASDKESRPSGAGVPEEQVRAFLRLLAENRRLPLVSLVAEQFHSLHAQAEARIDVDVVTAVADVPQAQRDALQEAIGRRLQRTVVMHWSADPALIGGAVVRAGDWVVDGSLRGELARLSQDLLR